jgi:CheY-like chemotaxis protein
MEDKAKVLVVEDESLLLQAIDRKLTKEGMEAVCFKTGEKAIDYLKSDESMPDVIWLDYYLTDMDGLEFMNTLKENDKWASIPVVVVSNSASPEKVNKMLVLGVKEYILKAENRLDDIIDTIRKYLNNKEEDNNA